MVWKGPVSDIDRYNRVNSTVYLYGLKWWVNYDLRRLIPLLQSTLSSILGLLKYLG